MRHHNRTAGEEAKNTQNFINMDILDRWVNWGPVLGGGPE